MSVSYDPTRPEEFNKLLNFRLTFSWLLLFIIFISIIFFIIWSSFTAIPLYVEGNGVFMNKSLIHVILSSNDCVINTVNAREGEKVPPGKVLATTEGDKNITAPEEVTIIQQWIYPSLYVREGTPLFTVEKTDFYSTPIVIAFFTIDEARMIEPGMEGLISFSGLDKSFSVKGKVAKVSHYPASPELMFYELGNKDIADYIKDQYENQENPLTDVTVSILENKDGTYEWIGEEPEFHIKTGTLCQCSIIAGKETFLEKLIPWTSR